MAEVPQSTALVLMGNFNLLGVCWKYNKAERKQRFLECVKDNFWTQLVNEPTRGAALPDVVFCEHRRTEVTRKSLGKQSLETKGPRKAGHTWRKKS